MLWLVTGVVLRLATLAPDGSGWARAARTFAREVEQHTAGRVRIKWYFNAVAGDEHEMLERLKKGQLDGIGSGGMVCERVMPSLRVVRLPGLTQTREEASYLIGALLPQLSAEARQAGFTYLTGAAMGPDMLFSRRPIRSFEELRQTRAWRWADDDVQLTVAREMGISVVPGAVDKAVQLFEQGKVDAFWSIPTAALVFQWAQQAPYLLDLHNGYLFGCALVASSAVDGLDPEDRRQLLAAGARLADAFTEITRETDDALLHGAFQHQGVTVVPASERLRAEFFAAWQAARRRLGEKLVPKELLDQVSGLLSDYRARKRR
jgi:TRAP-type C4-dicarboxylate transport system substrate-binding protein